MVERHVGTAADKELVEGSNWLHDILPHFKRALYLDARSLSAVTIDKTIPYRRSGQKVNNIPQAPWE
ncbi:hypothetical protein GCM10007158_31050 [Vreelandella hamiltonii]|uniref:Transposase n=1 Tax=Halomonas johnsoniae TaxID=502832 RepID=A0ABQ2WSI9_9GAMM|nr:hypothetical protein GCM10007158_31050 [Halomonas johnsoniae]